MTPSELNHFTKTVFSLIQKRHHLKKISLNDCALNDDQLDELIPLLCKFDWVTLNGYQKISVYGWTTLSTNLAKAGCKINRLELKITKHEDTNNARKTLKGIEELIQKPDCQINDKAIKALAPGNDLVEMDYTPNFLSVEIRGLSAIKIQKQTIVKSTDIYVWLITNMFMLLLS